MSIFRHKKSASSAKERLQLVLIHDRTDLNTTQLESLKDDLISAISHYVDIEPSGVLINITRDGRSQRLVADIPLKTFSHHRR
jgi:cell division topological specificity factor